MLQTGDLLFFRGDPNCALDKLIMTFTGSPYTHVGMFIQDPSWMTLKGQFCLQSNSHKQTAVEQGDRQSGVVLTPLSEMRDYEVRHLTTIRDEKFYQKLERVHAKVHNLSYDYSVLDWIRSGLYAIGFHWFATPKHTNNFWCSALCAFVYTELGLFEESMDWSNQSPADLATTEALVAPSSLSVMRDSK